MLSLQNRQHDYQKVTACLFADKIQSMSLALYGSTGKRIKLLRTGRDMNQKQLQAALKEHGVEVGSSFLSQLESSSKQPSLEMLIALAKVLNTTTDFLLMLTDDPSPSGSTDSQIVVDVSDRTERALIEDWLELMQDMEPERRESILRAVRLLIAPPQSKPPIIIGSESDKRSR